MPPEDTVYEVVGLKTFFDIQGTQDAPVKNMKIMGVNFRDSAYTYTDPHGMPSGGDWGIERMGVLFLEVSEEVLVDSCVLERLDGNAIMLSGYNRNTTIQRNEFVWIGSTAIALWGDTKGTNVTGMGWDGTDGNQPRFIRILYNFAHELGIWEKQSSLIISRQSLVRI